MVYTLAVNFIVGFIVPGFEKKIVSSIGEAKGEHIVDVIILGQLNNEMRHGWIRFSNCNIHFKWRFHKLIASIACVAEFMTETTGLDRTTIATKTFRLQEFGIILGSDDFDILVD